MTPTPRPASADPSSAFARRYIDWTLCGMLACCVAGFPNTPAGPLWLWAVVLPALAALLLRRHRRPRRSSGQGPMTPWKRAGRRRPLNHCDVVLVEPLDCFRRQLH